LFDGTNQFLDRIDLLFLKVGFAALSTHPCRNLVDRNVTAPAICMKGGMTFSHFALAMDALHCLILTLKSSAHSPESGIYAVMIAR
jgi:hypothetical protein